MRVQASIKSFMAVLGLAVLITAMPAQTFAAPYAEGGDIYRVRNVTKGTDFSDPALADKCDILQYKVRIHNPGPDEALTGVTVQAVFGTASSAQNISSIVIRASNASPSNTSDTATVNLSTPQKIAYIPGSSQLLGPNSEFIRGISDVTSGSGVPIGDVGVSVNEKRFVQFKAKVDCPQPPVTPPEQPPVTPPVTPPPTPSTPIKPTDRTSPSSQSSQPSVLPEAGAGGVFVLFASTVTLATAGHHLFTRRLSRI